jgi:hypothetical protein
MSKYLKSNILQEIKKWVKLLEKGKFAEKSAEWSKKLKLPYKEIGVGKHRVVFDLGNGLVLKVAKVAKGITCNKNEVDLYQSASSTLRKHLCKIVEYGYGWLIMKKINKIVPKKKKYKKQLIRILKKFRNICIRISDLTIKKSGNIKKKNIRLKRDKKIVIIDYANVYDC